MPASGAEKQHGRHTDITHISTPESLVSLPLRPESQEQVWAMVGFLQPEPRQAAPGAPLPPHSNEGSAAASPGGKRAIARSQLVKSTSYLQRERDVDPIWQWPPSHGQLMYFLRNTPVNVSGVRKWYNERFGSGGELSHRNAKGARGSYDADIENRRTCVLGTQLPFETPKPGESADKARFVIVKDECKYGADASNSVEPEGLYNVNLLRFYVEQEWNLRKPDVIISVTGGAAEFNFPSQHREVIMRGRGSTVSV